MTEEELQSLLFHSESDVLDFKQKAYAIRGGTDKQKAELAKDVVAFANAWRSIDAHILLGVEETPTPPARIIGIPAEDHPDDAVLQQLVNSKLNRAIRFRYERFVIEGLNVGVITIPAGQERPFFLNRPLEGLLPNVVYIRRGSSTDTANPDEVARMARALTRPAPQLRVEFADSKDRRAIGGVLARKVGQLAWPAKGSPDDIQLRQMIRNEHGWDYYDPLASGPRISKVERLFLQLRDTLNRFTVSMAMINRSTSVANDVRVRFLIPGGKGVEVPPEQFRDENGMPSMQNMGIGDGASVETRHDGWEVTLTAKKLQAMETWVLEDALKLVARKSCVISLEAQISADELTGPLQQTLTIEITSEPRLFQKALPEGA